jgi:hypothetical protein
MEIVKMHAPEGSKVRRGKPMTNCVGVTVHETDNTRAGADAMNHGRYLQGSGKDQVAGYHYAVDGTRAVECIPQSEICEHTGTRKGNDTTLCVEICVNSDGDINAAVRNAAELVAKLLRDRGFSRAVWKTNIFQHNDWNGKNCPSMIRRGYPVSWLQFVDMVNQFMQGSQAATKPIPALTRLLKLKVIRMRGDDVASLIRQLKAKGVPVGGNEITIFGSCTDIAVRKFQDAMSLKVDGIVGNVTWTALFS